MGNLTAYRHLLAALAAVAIFSCVYAAEQDKLLPVPDEIRVEATRPNDNPVGCPLPLAAHWNVGGMPEVGINPDAQMALIEQGHFLLPWFEWPGTDDFLQNSFKDQQSRDKWIAASMPYFEGALKKAAAWRLPISFLTTQWECTLTYDKHYLDLPAEQNPNVVDVNGKILREVDPFGPIAPWREVGAKWTATQLMKRVEDLYPEPPLVVLISNNEHAKLWWIDVEKSKRYMDKYGAGRDDDFKRKIVADGWIERYRALQQGVVGGLANPTWRKNALCVPYEAFGPCHLGRDMGTAENWRMYSSYSPGRIDPGPLMWDGASPSYYLHNWSPITDYKVWSPQIESMNWVFMLKEAYRLNPRYWFEISTWDGDVGDQPNNKRKTYASMGQALTPDRYEGMIQFGMWLVRPRVVRDFRGWMEKRADIEPYFVPIMNAVDRVHTNPILRGFWRNSELVPNRAHQHPYQTDMPEEYKNIDRWFLLDTNLDAPWPWTQSTEIPVFALARVRGQAPAREWLVFAHAPKGARTGVKITVPELGAITVDVPQTGSFFLVSEKTKSVTPVVVGGPASVDIDVKSPFVKAGEQVAFAATDAYAPQEKLTTFTWDFGDGKTGNGLRVKHAFRKAGQYIVTLKATGDAGLSVSHAVAIFAGIGPEDGLVLHYLMKPAPGDTLPDASGREHRGLLTGGQWAKDPQRGDVLEFDGAKSFVLVMNNPDINTAAKIANRTITFWFKAVEVKKRQMLFEEGGSGNGLNIYLEGGTLHAGLWIANLLKGSWLKSDEIVPGQWYHVALVLANGDATPGADKLALYVNGVITALGPAVHLTPHLSSINIGRNGDTLYPAGAAPNPGDYFAGRMDDFVIYNRALTREEIARIVK